MSNGFCVDVICHEDIKTLRLINFALFFVPEFILMKEGCLYSYFKNLPTKRTQRLRDGRKNFLGAPASLLEINSVNNLILSSLLPPGY